MKPDDERDQTTDTDAGSDPDRETTQRTSETRRPWIAAILGAVIGGMTAWGVAESPIGRFTPKQSNLRVMGMATGSKAATPEAIREAERLNAVRSIGVFGAMVGLGMGIASGAAFGDRRSILIAGIVGLMGGGMIGALTPLGAMPIFELIRTPGKQDLLPAILMHLTLWTPVGALGGLAFGLGRTSAAGPLLKSTISGAMGAAIGAALFQVAGTIAFPTVAVEKVVSTTWVSRLVARLTVAAGIALLAAMAQADGAGTVRNTRRTVA